MHMSNDSIKKIIDVSFRNDGKTNEFYTGNFVLNKGDRVLVETPEGMELGTVCSQPRLQHASMPDRSIRNVFRLATAEDIEKKEKNEKIEAEAMKFCKAQINNKKVPMDLIAVELSFDMSRLSFFYISANRVDFRRLVKELVHKFNTHVEMKQIGPRDLAGMIGGIGRCGRQLCCSLFLSNFDPISIKMAKAQDLSLNPDKISGICGRLMCCLAYEYDTYPEMKRNSRENNGRK